MPGSRPAERRYLSSLRRTERVERDSPCLFRKTRRALASGIDGAQLEVALDRLDRLAADGGEAVLAALAADAENAFLQVDVGDFEVDQLADADAAAVEDFEHGLVASAEEVGVAWGFEQLLDLIQIETLGQAFFLLGCPDGGEGVYADDAPTDQELVEAAQGCELPSGGALGVVLAVEIVEEFPNGERVTFDVSFIGILPRGGLAFAAPDLSAQKQGELDEVGAIALYSVVTEVLLELKIVEKLADQGGEVFFLH